MSSGAYEVLIIGCGNIAGGFDIPRASHLLPLSHAGAYFKHKGFTLTACVDPEYQRRQAFAHHWGVDKDAANLVELDAEPGAFDVISICSPTALHQEHLEQAIALRPRVIFCEKPITSDFDAAYRLVRLCNDNGITLVVNYSRRWDPCVGEMISQLREGRWGSVRSVVGHYNKGILNNGGHMVDLLMQLVGPLELIQTIFPVFDFWENDPTVAALLTAASGTVPVYLNPADARDYAYFELEVVCSLGVIRMESGGMGWQRREAVPSSQFVGYQTLDAATQTAGRYLETMTRAINEIHDHLQTGTPVSSSGKQALQAQELCMHIQRQALMK
jgi:predicted dehydrogenase